MANKLAINFEAKAQSNEAIGDSAAVAGTTPAEPAFPVRAQEALQAAARLKVLLGAGHVVTVTGIAAADAWTPLAAKLAISLAAMDTSPVLVIDANVREPKLHEIFGVPREPGFLDLLEDRANLEQATHKVELNNLFLLPAGQASGSLAALLSPPAARRLFDDIRRIYRYVVIDAGLIRNQPDGTLLASISDGVVAAVAVGARKRHEVLQFRQELKQLNIPFLGVVLTKEE